jgi:hypothetical protein
MQPHTLYGQRSPTHRPCSSRLWRNTYKHVRMYGIGRQHLLPGTNIRIGSSRLRVSPWQRRVSRGEVVMAAEETSELWRKHNNPGKRHMTACGGNIPVGEKTSRPQSHPYRQEI